MSIAFQAKAIQAVLADWAEEAGGAVFVASDLSHMWRMATAKSDTVRAIIVYTGEEIRGDFSVAAALGRVDRHFTVMITRGRGFNSNRGDSLTETMGNAPPLYDLVEQARDLIRAMDNASVELPVDYHSVRNTQLGDLILDAYQIEFSLAADLPRILSEPEDIAVPDSLQPIPSP